MTPFYNTNKESFDEFFESSKQAVKQEVVILKVMQRGEPMSPSMVYAFLDQKWPITSIRRAMTNLTDDGKIIKTQETVKGIYGKREHLWALPRKPEVFDQANLFDF